MITEPIVTTSVQKRLSTRIAPLAPPGRAASDPTGGASVIPGHSWEELLWAWRELDAPKGWRTEILDGGIALTPWRRPAEVAIAAQLHNALLPACSSGMGVFQSLSVTIAGRGLLVVPDLAVAPLSSLDTAGPVLAGDLGFVVEITSEGSASRDRETKRLGYAHAPVPLYLLVDAWEREEPTVTLFSDPSGGDYRRKERVVLGKPVTVPAPFNVELNLSEFQTE